MLARPNQSIIFLENDNHRIGAESVCGVQDAFHRYVDADIIYFQFAGQTTLGTTADFKGIVLCATAIVLNTGATLEGRALAQTAVTLQMNAVTEPK